MWPIGTVVSPWRWRRSRAKGPRESRVRVTRVTSWWTSTGQDLESVDTPLQPKQESKRTSPSRSRRQTSLSMGVGRWRAKRNEDKEGYWERDHLSTWLLLFRWGTTITPESSLVSTDGQPSRQKLAYESHIPNHTSRSLLDTHTLLWKIFWL